MKSILPAHIVSSVFCFVSSLLIAYQVIRHPNKVRLSILGYSIFTLPASIINTLTVEGGIISPRANSLVYLVSTLLMGATHFFMMLDVGYRLRTGSDEKVWKHPLVIVGIVFLSFTGILLLAQIIILAVNKGGSEEYPLKGCFITGVVCCIIGDSSIFTFTFLPLMSWRKTRSNHAQQKTTALGIWFFSVQNIWYILYGTLYIWFFAMNSWNYFSTLLAFDYVLRFIENLLYTWPPPSKLIDYLSIKLSSTSIQMKYMSSEQYNNTTDIENVEPYSKDNITYDSRVTIVNK